MLRARAVRWSVPLLIGLGFCPIGCLFPADDQSPGPAEIDRPLAERAVRTPPEARITCPDFAGNPVPLLPQSFWVDWATAGTSRPSAWDYKLVRLPAGSFPSPDPSVYASALRTGINLLLDPPGTEWIRVALPTRTLHLEDLPANSAYAFGVLAVDALGNPEADLVHNRNMIAFAVTAQPWQPHVTVREPQIGAHDFPSEGDIWEVQIPNGFCLNFSWDVGYPQTCGADPVWNYALDIPDPNDETPSDPEGIGGWIGWGDWTGNRVPFCFPEEQAGTTHWFYLRCRLDGGDPQTERLCTIRIEVVEATFSRFALLVDDARFTAGVSDLAHDAFLNDVFLRRLHEYGPVDQIALFSGSGEIGYPAAIPLETLLSYRIVVWSCEARSTISGIASGLGGGYTNEIGLKTYLRAGGRLFIFGGRIAGMNRGVFDYPIAPPSEIDDARDMLYYQSLFMRSTIISRSCDGGPGCDDCYPRTSGLYAARALQLEFPDLELDPSKWNPFEILVGDYRGGLPNWEGMHLGSATPEKVAGVESLYAADTWDRSLDPPCDVPSPAEGAICAWRFRLPEAETLPHRWPGRVVVLDFQPYWFLPGPMKAAGTASIEWLVAGGE